MEGRGMTPPRFLFWFYVLFAASVAIFNLGPRTEAWILLVLAHFWLAVDRLEERLPKPPEAE